MPLVFDIVVYVIKAEVAIVRFPNSCEAISPHPEAEAAASAGEPDGEAPRVRKAAVDIDDAAAAGSRGAGEAASCKFAIAL